MNDNSPASNGMQAYLALLGAHTPKELYDKIITRVRSAIGSNPDVPVKLSQCARTFQIIPQPEFDNSVRDGELVYSEGQHSFVIRLNAEFKRPSAPDDAHLYPSDMYDDLVGRARFTYAHEFCHRFFFIDTSAGCERAIAVIARQYADLLERTRFVRAASLAEETLCNRFAGDVLVPDRLLTSLLSSWGISNLAASDNIFSLVDLIKRNFNVSRECAFVRIERWWRAKKIDIAEGFTALWISQSQVKGGSTPGSSGKSRLAARIKVAIWPHKFGNLKIRRIFPGIAVENLGEELSEFVDMRLSEETSTTCGTVCLPVRINTCADVDNTASLVLHLRAQWVVISSNAPRMSRRLFIWGTLGK